MGGGRTSARSMQENETHQRKYAWCLSPRTSATGCTMRVRAVGERFGGKHMSSTCSLSPRSNICYNCEPDSTSLDSCLVSVGPEGGARDLGFQCPPLVDRGSRAPPYAISKRSCDRRERSGETSRVDQLNDDGQERIPGRVGKDRVIHAKKGS